MEHDARTPHGPRLERRDSPETDLPRMRVDDLQPHEGLRYIARLFKVLALLLILLLVAEVVIGLLQAGRLALPTLMVEATRLVVFAAFLWAAGDIVLMLIESNHDLRALRIGVSRIENTVQRLEQSDGGQPSGGSAPSPRTSPPAGPRSGAA